jgi:hypothetical protein
MSIPANLQTLQEKIAAISNHVGRNPLDITLVAVSKTVGPDEIVQLLDQGQVILGENRPQALRDKAKDPRLARARWHFIGNLQTNKMKYVYPVAELVHSVDRLELVEEFGNWFRKTGRKCPFLLEVHISDETSKSGFAPDEVMKVIQSLKDRDDIDVRGLMGMAPFVDDETVVRGAFRRLAALLAETRACEGGGYRAQTLSMGMSDDFHLAIEEGSTMIRVGRALFES